MRPALLDLPFVGGLSEQLQGFVDAPGVAPLAFIVAFATGAAHALGPGHGKSLAAAYLIGSEGRMRDAAWLGGSVAVMHTFSVLVIAVAWTFFSLSDLVRLESLTAGLQLVAGLVVVAAGLWLVRRHVRHGGHHHGHGHGHGHGIGLDTGSTVPREPGSTSKGSADKGAPGSTNKGESGSTGKGGPGSTKGTGRPGLLLLGLSGGLVPSPSAFFVLVTGLFLGRAGFALLLVVTFGVGMALVLFVVGLLALAGTNVVTRAAESRAALRLATRVAPLLAAGSVTLLGGVITVVAARSLTAA
jgi:nickel/cobalt transporter (NicO) family protein